MTAPPLPPRDDGARKQSGGSVMDVTDEMIAAGSDAEDRIFADPDAPMLADRMAAIYTAMHALRPVPAVEITEAMVEAGMTAWIGQGLPSPYEEDVRAILTAALGARADGEGLCSAETGERA